MPCGMMEILAFPEIKMYKIGTKVLRATHNISYKVMIWEVYFLENSPFKTEKIAP